MNKKKIILFSGIIFITIISFVIFNPFQKNIDNTQNPELEKYITEYTSGVIPKDASIIVRLTSNTIENLKENYDINDVFDFSPDIDGTTNWIDTYTLEFKPNNTLDSDQEYEVTFSLDKLIDDVPDELEEFIFNFKTIKQSFELTIDQQITIDKKALRWQKVIGYIQTADIENSENIKKIIHAFQDKNELKINWKDANDDKIFYFEIDSIRRLDKTSIVNLEYNGQAINVESSGSEEITIPAYSDFSFISAKVVNSPEQYVQIQFSDPLLSNQDLRGLIKIKNAYNLKFEVENNIIKAFPASKLVGVYDLTIYEGVQNIIKSKFKSTHTEKITFEEIKPAVRFVSKGVILPKSDKGLVLPFECVNLNAVDVRITKIYNNNILQFLQSNNLDGNYDLRRVGKTTVEKTVKLDQFNVVDFGRWNRFVLDLNELITVDQGAIYRVSINFRKSYSTYKCEDSGDDTEEEIEEISWDYFDDYYYGEYDTDNYWDNRDNPCSNAYFGKRRQISQNILASDLGIIVKRGKDNTVTAFVTDILTTKPLNNVNIEVYDYQQQLIKSSTTDNNGIAKFVEVEDIQFIIAKHNTQFGYVKLNDGNSLSLSMFDVSGVSLNKGMKGFIYGERGVWRPGDSLFVSFMLQEENKPLPKGHPIIMTLYNTDYQKVKKIVQKKNSNNIYTFKFKTNQEDKTGNWSVKVDVGGTKFSKTIKVETIKPNRLKIKLDFNGAKELKASTETFINLHSDWLHGATGKNLKAKVDVKLYKRATTFEKYKEYNFDDPSKGFYPETNTIFNGKTDENGNANFLADFKIGDIAPGKLNAIITTKVFEPGGSFSINQTSIPYSPYKSYTGIKIRKLVKNKMMLTDTTQYADVVILDDNGKPITLSHRVEMEIYKLEWRWWWQNQNEYLSNYIGRSYIHPIKKETVNTSNGKLSWKFRVNYPDWGRYLIRATDKVSGHSTAKIIYLDWPGWYSRENKDHSQGATMLSFTTDKDKYEVDDEIIVTIPSSEGGRALISIENGTKIINTEWVATDQTETTYKFKATKEMAPNAYINVSLIQPHSQTVNDLPIRLYGIVPILVEDAETHLHPIIDMPDKIESETDVTIKIEEENGNDMSFTVAVVDEGLLDITNFTTPDPWNHFYAKEALGVVSWDIYDYVIGAYGGKLDRLLNIGGGGSVGGKSNKKANRFKPVVKFFGPYYLKGGSERVIKFKMPKYIGSVKTMVVAKHKKAYGTADKVSKVIKPLMILGTLPRTLSPGETVSLPVSVFAMEKNIKNVKVSIKANDLFTVIGKSTQQVVFKKPDEKTVFFELKVNSKVGIGKVDIIASSGSKKSTYNIELDVKNPNPESTDVISEIVEAGNTLDINYSPIGLIGTNKVTVEVSSIPPLNLEKRLKYLIKYPHGCVEQTTSGAFPQLYLENISELTDKQKQDIERNVKHAIEKLLNFQLSNGGLGYWPGSSNVSEWGTNYAGHFLVEAKKKGYVVSNSFIKKWKKYQKSKASNWTNDGPSSQFIQAYRLYTLSLEGSPDISSMNRLKSAKNLSQNAKWRLAAAYALAGKTKTAEKLITGLAKIPVSNYIGYYSTYGSQTRDKAMILETLDLLNKKSESYDVLKSVSSDLASNGWMSTQTIAYSLISISKFVNNNITVDDFKFSFSDNNGKLISKSSKKPILQIKIPVKNNSERSLKIKNTSGGIIFARVILTGIPEIGTETDAANKLNVSVIYQTLDGKYLNIENIEQGTDFKAIVTVRNPTSKTYRDLALSQVFPSGWEIINSRLFDTNSSFKVDKPDYEDIRDDRVYSYFDLYGLRSKTFSVHLNASYKGKYYMPAVNCEAMYDGTINARKKGMWVEVIGN